MNVLPRLPALQLTLPVPTNAIGERNTCDVIAKAQQSLLQHNVARLRIGASFGAMMEIAAADLSSGLVAYREPRDHFRATAIQSIITYNFESE